jgi:hypothetical protein
MPENLESDWNAKASFIQSECNQFFGSIEHVTKRKLSGHGVGDLVRCLPFVAIGGVWVEWRMYD